ncbi:MAG: hypothetical protein ACREFU_19115 [Acetobacteraceae bacterium]
MASERTSTSDPPWEDSGNVVIDRLTEYTGEQVLDPHPLGSHAEMPAVKRPRALNWSVLVAAVGGWAVILVAFWLAFAGEPYVMGSLFIVCAVSVVILGMIFGLGYWANQTRFPSEVPVHVSFSEFMRGDVQTFTGRLPGRDILVLISGISAGLAVGGVGFAIIVALVS